MLMWCNGVEEDVKRLSFQENVQVCNQQRTKINLVCEPLTQFYLEMAVTYVYV